MEKRETTGYHIALETSRLNTSRCSSGIQNAQVLAGTCFPG